jgi:hypothetical protein
MQGDSSMIKVEVLSVVWVITSLCSSLSAWASLPEQKEDSFKNTAQDFSATLKEKQNVLMRQQQDVYHAHIAQHEQMMAEMERWRKQIQQERDDMKRLLQEQQEQIRLSRSAMAEQIIRLKETRDEMDQNRREMHAVQAMLRLEDQMSKQHLPSKKVRNLGEQERMMERFDEILNLWDNQQNNYQNYLETLNQHLQNVKEEEK